LLEESVRNLREDSRPVASLRIASASTAVRQIHQDLQPLLDDRVGLRALNVRHKTNDAGVVLEMRVIESVKLRDSWPIVRVHGESFILKGDKSGLPRRPKSS